MPADRADKVFIRVASNWGLEEDVVRDIYQLATSFGYGKTSRLLVKFGLRNPPSVRQVRYLVRTVRLTRRYGDLSDNHRDMIERRA